MTLVQLSAMTEDLLSADAATPTQADRDMIQSMLVRWKNSYTIDGTDDQNLEDMAAKICRYREDNKATVSRGIWTDFKVTQGWITDSEI